ncbi:efflux RND transporter permease subunit [Halobacteriovorax marinus]|uniref:efflux RND transporter permease subunit n=1 Tax=Halobacteriovorax marinus TaxID=97084 RepID=UPI003A91A742
MKALLKYLFDNPLITKFTFIIILVGALIGMKNLKRTSYPQVDLHKVIITTFYPDASPNDVEVNITNNLEYELKKVEGVKYYTSRSMEGQSTITMVLDQEYGDFQSVKDNIYRALDKVRNLPSRVTQRPKVMEMKVDNFPIYDVALISNEMSEEEVIEVTKKLRRKILQIPEIYKAEVSGKREKEFQIILDPKKLTLYDISFEDVINAVKGNQIRATGGTIESFVNEKKIITLSEMDTPKKLRNIIVRSNYSGKKVRVSDLGEVSFSFSKKNIMTSYNGDEGIGLWLYKVPSSDIIRTIDKVRKVIADFKEENKSRDLKIVNTHDLSSETRSRLEMVYSNIIMGLILILAILIFFFNIKLALWVCVGIPFSLAFLMIAMPLLGLTLNSISLCGVIVVLGMIVDDAIIVSEAIYSRDGNSEESLIKAVLGVARPISITILTTIISFIPIYFIPGMMGQFTAEIPSVVIIVLLGSFFESLIFLPIHLRNIKSGTVEELRATHLGKRTMNFLESQYSKLLKKLIFKKEIALVSLISILALFLSIGIYKFKFQMFPEFQAQRIYLYGDVERGKTLEYTAQIAKKVESVLQNVVAGDIKSFRTRVGRNYEGQYHCEQCFYTKLELTHFNSRERSALDIESKILEEIKGISELKSFGSRIDSGAPPRGNDLELVILSDNESKRVDVIRSLESKLKELGEVSNDFILGDSSLVLRPLYEKMSRMGTNVQEVAKSLRIAFSGEFIGFISKGDERNYIKVTSNLSDKGFGAPLEDLSVLNNQGRKIPLKKLVSLQEEKMPVVLTHYNGESSNTLSINKITRKDAKEVISKIVKDVKSEFSDVDIILKGRMFKDREGRANLFLGALITCLIIYFSLVILYKSYLLPLLICSSVPVGLIGILFSFKIHGAPLSALGLVGIIGFIGVVINDALLMVEVMKEPKSIESIDGLARGATKRFAPIFLTTITTVFGLLPSIYGFLGGTDAFISPMVLSMGSGLLFGTISDLILIPLVFGFIYRDKHV